MKSEEYRKLEERKTSLTSAEKLRVAVAVIVDGFEQHKVAALMGVNPGRVAEAVTAVRKALNIPEEPVDLFAQSTTMPMLGQEHKQ